MIPEQVIDQILRRVSVDPERGCWYFTGPTTRGYGTVHLPRPGGNVYTHRAMYENRMGEIPDGLCVLHKCDNPRCCNPEHLFLGTRTDNHNDMVSKGRSNRGERNGSAKLTEKDARAIRRDPRTLREIAADYGLDFSTVGYIKRGARWSHVVESKSPRQRVRGEL